MTRLLVEPTLGRLATWLRLLGLDTALAHRLPPRVPEGVVLLTRRRALAGRPGTILITHDDWPHQLRQALAALGGPPDPTRRFSRCLVCNQPVEPLARERAAGRVPEHVLANAETFTHCPACGRVYWPGSHGQRAAELLARVVDGRAMEQGRT